MSTGARIPQFNRKYQERGGILKQRRRSTVKLQSDFCILARRRHEAWNRLQALLIDVCSEAGTHRLSCGRIAPRASCRSQLRNPGWSGSDARKKTDLAFVLKRLVVVSVTNGTVGLFRPARATSTIQPDRGPGSIPCRFRTRISVLR